MLSEGGLVHRYFLDRLLGTGQHRIVDSSGAVDGPQHRIEYHCGCVAHERDLGRFKVEPCGDHADRFTGVSTEH